MFFVASVSTIRQNLGYSVEYYSVFYVIHTVLFILCCDTTYISVFGLYSFVINNPLMMGPRCRNM
jgi:hypothetical protein